MHEGSVGIDLVDSGWNLEEECTKLLLAIYGTKKAARQHWKKFKEVMKQKEFETTHAEPCLIKR
jgi:hypothetical protein